MSQSNSNSNEGNFLDRFNETVQGPYTHSVPDGFSIHTISVESYTKKSFELYTCYQAFLGHPLHCAGVRKKLKCIISLCETLCINSEMEHLSASDCDFPNLFRFMSCLTNVETIKVKGCGRKTRSFVAYLFQHAFGARADGTNTELIYPCEDYSKSMHGWEIRRRQGQQFYIMRKLKSFIAKDIDMFSTSYRNSAPLLRQLTHMHFSSLHFDSRQVRFDRLSRLTVKTLHTCSAGIIDYKGGANPFLLYAPHLTTFTGSFCPQKREDKKPYGVHFESLVIAQLTVSIVGMERQEMMALLSSLVYREVDIVLTLTQREDDAIESNCSWRWSAKANIQKTIVQV